MKTMLNMNIMSFSGLLIFLSTFPMGSLVYLKGRNKKINQLWSFLCVLVSIWGIGSFKFSATADKNEALFWWQIATVGSILIPVAYYQFVCAYLQLKKKHLDNILILAYALGATFLVINFIFPEFFIGDLQLAFNQFYMPELFNRKNPIYSFFYVIFYWVLLGYSFSLLIISYRDTKGVFRNQLKYVLLGSVIGWLGPHGVFLSTTNWFNIYPYSNILIAIYPLIFTYAIFRYRLLDIDLVIKKSMVYSLVAGILTSLFIVIVLTMTKFVSNIAGISSFVITTIAAITIAFLFNPLKNKIQSFIDKNFYKSTYEYFPTIREISRKLTSTFDLHELFNYVGNIIYSRLGLANVYLICRVPGKGYETVYYKSRKKRKEKNNIEDQPALETDIKKLNSSSELIKFLKKSDEVLIKDELSRFKQTLGEEIIERINNELMPFHGEVVVPVFDDKKLILLLILGEKISGRMFTNEDVNLFNIISNQIAIAIKNAHMYKDKVNTERLASIGMMSATFAHEIRNPLTSLKTFAQLMPEKYNDIEFRDTFSRIVVGEIERIDGLISDLLDFSSDKKSTRINNFGLMSLVDETINYVSNKIEMERRDIKINKKYTEDEILMSGDSEKLKQTFINILMNGCQAMNGTGILTVKINKNSRYAEIAITDTGTGIHPDEISTIFDPFVTNREMGVGLGLAISKRIIEDHNGKINVKSKLSKGTTFTISLPVQKE